ncbi:argonaute 2 [Dorcoceras hygrometricum]|uniref:Argonaute 2 n=1 Tax=Dorcoceras hygrometricum TaxID=472368 RepID=A0A2Z6ZUP7_9LAMI|nr:argonaute 2 [Dorcoceras hygrometricum]
MLKRSDVVEGEIQQDANVDQQDAIWIARFSRKIQQKRKRSSSRLESAGAKQLTTYEELRELNVNC